MNDGYPRYYISYSFLKKLYPSAAFTADIEPWINYVFELFEINRRRSRVLGFFGNTAVETGYTSLTENLCQE